MIRKVLTKKGKEMKKKKLGKVKIFDVMPKEKYEERVKLWNVNDDERIFRDWLGKEGLERKCMKKKGKRGKVSRGGE
jgi:hypothetical protein